jgi:protein tyrosine phosphatase (PTP) superfamily phosphohydrolase (DUF442 family)
MRHVRDLLATLTLALAATAAAAQPVVPPPDAAAAPPALLNAREPLPGVRTGGVAENPAIFATLAAEGFRLVVDLRSTRDPIGDAPATAAAAGLDYVAIPIAGEADLDLGAARALDAVLDDAARGPAVVVCSSGNRSGALLAVRAFWLDRMPAAEALALGQRAGLTRLEPSVRTLLGLPPMPTAESPPPPTPLN